MSDDIHLVPGSHVIVRGVEYVITHLLDVETLIGTRTDTGQREFIKIADVESVPGETPMLAVDLHDASPEQITEANEMLAAIKPLLEMKRRKREDVEAVAQKMGVDAATVYRWIKRFHRTGTLASLIKEKPSGGKGDSRLSEDVEKIIKHYVDEQYLTEQKIQDGKIVEEIRDACKRAGLRVPHGNTIRARLKRIPGRLKAEKRGDRRGLESYTPTPGKFPMAKFVQQVYQIDHTRMDIEIVDDKYRLPIGRPWLTLAIDVYSRMVAGMVVSLEPPSALSVGLAIVHAIMPKDNWLAERGIEFSWPIFGKPAGVHADNGPDFVCDATTLGCQNNLIDIYWRKVGKPHYGGHIERLLGTVATELKTLPGATFSNPKERGDYDSVGKAVMSMKDVETWVVNFLLGKYHNRKHSSLETTPLKRFEEGIYGTKTVPGRGLLPRPTNGRRLLIDFLPYWKRPVRPDGVVIEKVHYFARAIEPFTGQRDADGERVKYRFHRDPRAIAPIFCYDPTTKDYIDVPYSDLSREVISAGELKAAKKIAKTAGDAAVDEDAIFKAVAKMRKVEQEAARTTKEARRNVQRGKSRQESLISYPTAKPKLPANGHVEPEPVETPRQSEVVVPYEVEEFDA